MALIMPVFLMLVFGCIDFGRFAYSLIAVTNAAGAGAAAAVMSRYPDPDPTNETGLTNWRSAVCAAVAGELGMADDFTSAGSADPDGACNSQGLYVRASRAAETGAFWHARIVVRAPFTWWSIPSSAQPQQTVVYRAIR
jgi:Flp pilus assembly protein TadG